MVNVNIPEWFYSIQGEGLFSGCPSFFIRLSECPLRCKFCDTKYMWKRSMHDVDLEEFYEVNFKSLPENMRHVVITGGEPMYQKNYDDLVNIIKFFLEKKYTVTVETTGLNQIDDLFNNDVNFITNFQKLRIDSGCIGKYDVPLYLSVSPKFNLEAYQDHKEIVEVSHLNRFYSLMLLQSSFLEDHFYYKFVYEDEESFKNMKKFITRYVPKNMLHKYIYIMPMTPLNKKEKDNKYLNIMLESAELCKELGVRFSPRVHIILWDFQKYR